MSQLLNKEESALGKGMRQKDAFTTNGAVTNSTSLNACVDLFFLAGASRTMPKAGMIKIFIAAFVENPLMATKILFWSRDVRGGAGERNFFRVILKYMFEHYSDVFEKNVELVPEYGYWKDFWKAELPLASYISLVKKGLEEKNGLLAKWLPRQGPLAKELARELSLTPKEFRKKVVELSKTVEQQMSAKQWGAINYSHVPSKAFKLYQAAFTKQDPQRFAMFLQKAKNGEVKINASAILPYELYKAYATGKANEAALEAQWAQLPNYMEDTEERILPICDVSGSMAGLPMEISISLGIYISERNTGIFKDAFLTFDTRPQMLFLKGNLTEKVRQLAKAPWGGSTNFEASFDLILEAAVREKLPETEMPTKLLCISDMEFNEASRGGKTNFEVIREKYAKAGYKMPSLVFWNVNGRPGNSPVTVQDKNVALVSGSSPSILPALYGDDITPQGVMQAKICTERYDKIRV